ncbi:MAG: rhodanese-related sulfurtransferase [Pseudomonadota bacterium]
MVQVATFYRFATVPDPGAFKAALAAASVSSGVRGSILIAPEGVNGTIAGAAMDVRRVLDRIRAEPGFNDLRVAWSEAGAPPFGRLKIRIKREIVTMGRPGLDPAAVGTRVAPADWNALIAAPDVAVIDTRNAYETAIGTFDGAIDPGTERFGDFPDWWAANAARFADKRIAMFCTGGIRCEKSTAFLKSQGVADVYHLDGGILSYLDAIPAGQSRWRGACFVFDERVAVGHGLRETAHTLCRACRRPVSPADLSTLEYEPGTRCAACKNEYSAADRARFRERHRQVQLAEARGARHLAPGSG